MVVARKRWKCNCDWISSASRSIEVAVRKLTGAPGSRSLGQPFHRSNPTIENSVAPRLASNAQTLDSSSYIRILSRHQTHHAFPSFLPSFLHLVFFSHPLIIYRIVANLTPPSVHIFVPNSNIQIRDSHTYIYIYVCACIYHEGLPQVQFLERSIAKIRNWYLN